MTYDILGAFLTGWAVGQIMLVICLAVAREIWRPRPRARKTTRGDQ